MKKVSFGIVSCESPGRSFLVTDFRLGRIQLYRHFQLEQRSALDTRPKETALELLGETPGPFPGGRVPLFVCPLCADLGCGALCVAVEFTSEGVVWRNFGWDGPGVSSKPQPTAEEVEAESEVVAPQGHKGPSPSEIIARTGPFLMDTDEYVSAVSQFRHVRRRR